MSHEENWKCVENMDAKNQTPNEAYDAHYGTYKEYVPTKEKQDVESLPKSTQPNPFSIGPMKGK
jgi:hypothetical protein